MVATTAGRTCAFCPRWPHHSPSLGLLRSSSALFSKPLSWLPFSQPLRLSWLRSWRPSRSFSQLSSLQPFLSPASRSFSQLSSARPSLHEPSCSFWPSPARWLSCWSSRPFWFLPFWCSFGLSSPCFIFASLRNLSAESGVLVVGGGSLECHCTLLELSHLLR